MTSVHANELLEKIPQEKWQQIIQDIANTLQKLQNSEPSIAIVDLSFQSEQGAVPQKVFVLQRQLTEKLQNTFLEQAIPFDDVVSSYEEWTIAFPDATPPGLWLSIAGIIGAEFVVSVAILQTSEVEVQTKTELYDALISKKVWEKLYQWNLQQHSTTEPSLEKTATVESSDMPMTPENEAMQEIASDFAISEETPKPLNNEGMVLLLFGDGNDFLIDQTEVTLEEFQKCQKCQKGKGAWESQNLKAPVVYVSFEDAQNYCQWQNKRLPTQEEWVHAATTDTQEEWWLDANLAQEYAWFVQDDVWQAQPVATKKQNDWGLFDMSGNVAEWTTSVVESPESKDYFLRIVKGGAWGGAFGQGDLQALNPNASQAVAEWTRSFLIGFRCVRDAN